MINLIHGDCLIEMKKLIDNNIKVDLILTDPPYGNIKGLRIKNWNEKTTEWDNKIPTDEMFDFSNQLLRQNGVMILFSQEPYTTHLRSNSIKNLPFLYPLYWLKDHFANNLSVNKAPVNYIEELNVFRKKYDVENSNPLRKYSKRILEELNLTNKDIEKRLGHRRAEHFFYIDSTQFGLCTEKTYNELIDVFNIDEFPFFKPYDELVDVNSKFEPTFNFDGKYKSNVFEYSKSYNHFHPTEKPVPLLEDLILTYSNEGDVVLDFTMGSGSTGVACKNLNRDFIGIEIDEDFFNIARERCEV